jgi:hypothetical protein
MGDAGDKAHYYSDPPDVGFASPVFDGRETGVRVQFWAATGQQCDAPGKIAL